MSKFPTEAGVIAHYGNPSGIGGNSSPTWKRNNLVQISIPWATITAWDGKPVKTIAIHKLLAKNLTDILNEIWVLSGHNQHQINRWGMNIFGGDFNYRLKRGGSSLSMHSYGIALDFDPARNGFGDITPAMNIEVVKIFEKHGWMWGGRWRGKYCDGMHFQATS